MTETPTGGEQISPASGILGTNNLQRAVDSFDRTVTTLASIVANLGQAGSAYRSGQSVFGSWNRASNWAGGTNGGNPTFGGQPMGGGSSTSSSGGGSSTGATPNGGTHRAPGPASYWPMSGSTSGAHAGPGNGFSTLGFAVGAASSLGSQAKAFYGGQTTNDANADRMTYSTTAWSLSTAPVNATSLFSRYGGNFLNGTDQAQATSIMSSFAGASPNTARFTQAQQAVNQFATANPMASGVQSATAAKSLYGAQGIFGLRRVGIQTVARGGKQNSPIDIANQILNQVDPGQTVRTKEQADTLINDPNGPLRVTLGNWVAAGIIDGNTVDSIVRVIQDILRARQSGVSATGLQSLENARTSGSSAAASKLKSMGIGSSDAQITKDLAATERQPSINNISSFDKGLQESTQSLISFKTAVNDVMKATGLNALLGLASGNSANGKLGAILGASHMLSGVPGLGGLTPTSSLMGGLSGIGEVGHLIGGIGGSNESRMSVTSGAGGGGGHGGSSGGGPTGSSSRLAGGGSSGGGSGSRFIYPVGKAPITEAYGVKNSGYAAGHHTGVDFGVPVGTPVHAAAAGTVVNSGWGGDYGNYIVIDHHNGLWTLYAHNSRLLAGVGANVRQGQVIAYSGNTGNTTGPHCHFEVRKGANRYGADVNPMPYLGGTASMSTPSGSSSSSPGSSTSGSSGGTPTTGAGSSTSLGSGTSYTVTSSSGAGTAYGAGMSELDVLQAGGGSGASSSTSVTYSDPGTGSYGSPGGGGGSPSPGGSSYTGSGPVGTVTGGSPSPSSLTGNRSIVNSVAAGFGWNNGAEWAALSALVASESSWNNKAQNPTSTAYGLFQFLDSTWAGYGPKTSDPSKQSIYGLEYIKRRYGDPIHAWAFHKAHNWYDKGAWDIPSDQDARIHKGEMILPAQAARQIREVLVNGNPYGEMGNQGKGSGGQGVVLQFNNGAIQITMSGSATTSEAQAIGKAFVDSVMQDDRIRKLQKGVLA